MRTNPKIIPDGELDKEYNLSAITVERIDLVDEPCVPKAVIRIIKNKEDIKVADEKEVLELTEEEQAQLEKSLADAAKLIQEEMGKVKDEKKKKRLNLILASLKGLTKKEDDEEEEEDKEKKKVKKSDSDDDGDGEEEIEDLEKALKDEFLAEIKEDLKKELKEEVEKAGRSISRKTASELEKIVATIKNALSSLESITKPGQHDGPKKDEEYEDKYPKPKKKATKKSFDLTDLEKQTKRTYVLFKNDQIDDKGKDEFVDGLFDIMKSMQEINEEEGGE